ncbi:MAG: HD domain-containing protein [Ferrovibrionaceae bacterium]
MAPLALLDTLLESWKAQIGPAFPGYRNHCQRMAAFTLALLPRAGDDDRRKIAIAACFHDLGIWSDGTIDYLPPSSRRARVYLAAEGLEAWATEIELMIDEHHKLRAFKDPTYPLVEAFRKADLVDVSLGLVKFGIAGDTVRALKAAYPNDGFHKTLMGLAGSWFKRHPLSPPPFIKW